MMGLRVDRAVQEGFVARSTSTNRIAIVFIILAMLVGSGVVYMVFRIVGQATVMQASRPIRSAETVPVVIAKRTLYQGVSVTNEDLDVIELPPGVLPIVEDPTTETTVAAEVFSARERVVGQVPRERILPNEIIRPERLADGNAGVGLNAVIPRGMRAISVPLNGADAISGFLEPGSYVDVLVTMEDELGRPRTQTILQAVFVLGVNSRAANEEDAQVYSRGKQSPSVTFLVTPKQAEDLAFADALGSISLSLRNVQDVNYETVAGATMEALLERYKRKVEEPVKKIERKAPIRREPEGTTVKVIRGNQTTNARFDD